MIDKLNLHYAFTNPASIHDEEALTSLELAGRQGAKINEVVDNQNSLRAQTEAKMEEQDSYIKSTIPKEVDENVKNHIKNGTFSKDIDTYAGNLSARVDHLLGSLEEGSTTGDAELIDARVSPTDYVFDNVGQALRETTNQFNAWSNMITSNIVVNQFVQATPESGYMLAAHHVKTAVSIKPTATYYFAEMLVNGGDILKVKAGSHFGNYLWAFYDENNTPIDTRKTVGDPYDEYEGYLIVPANAVKIQASWGVGANLGTSGYLAKVTDFYFRPANEEYTKNLGELLATAKASYSPVDAPLIPAYITSKMEWTYQDAYTSYEMMEDVPVEAGKVYHIRASAHYNCYLYVVKDIHGNVVDALKSPGNAEHVEEFDSVYIMPYNAKTITVCGTSYGERVTTPSLQVATSLSNVLTGNGKIWVAFGDSLTEKNHTANVNYTDIVSEDLGLILKNHGVSGTGYYRDENASNVNLSAWHKRIENLANEEFDVITLFGSGNDMGGTLGSVTDTGTSTICGCINKTLNRLFEINPSAKIGIITPTPWGSYPVNQSGNKMELYSNALVEIAKRRGLPYLDLYHTSGMRPENDTFNNMFFYEEDRCHPNEAGHGFIAPAIREFVRSLI